LFSALVLVSSLSGICHGATSLIFPRLSLEQNLFTGITVVNPTKVSAQVTVTAYAPDGSTKAEWKKVYTIGAGKQKVGVLSDWFGAAKLPEGWFELTSSVDGLTGFFLVVNGSGTLLDGADLPDTGEEIVFNQVRAGNGYSTELNLVNPLAKPAQVNLKLQGSDIANLSKSVTIPAKGSLRTDASKLFGLALIPVNSFVAATSTTAIAGFELVRNAGRDAAAMNAKRVREQLNELYFPQMAVLGTWKTEIGLNNYSNQPVILTISAFKPDGALYDTTAVKKNPVTVDLEKNGSVVLDVAQLFGFQGNTTKDGWIKVSSSSPTINGYISYGVPGAAYGCSAVVASAPEGRKTALFSHIATVQGFFTGLAVLNPGALAANIRIMAFGGDGAKLGIYDTTLPPGHRISNVIQELVPSANNKGGGFIWISSSVPVFTTSLFGTATFKMLSNIPPQLSPSGYAPDTGTARLEIDPPLAALQPAKTQKFSIKGLTGAVTWKVNGIKNGDDNVGKILTDGTYTAPSAAKLAEARVITVTADVTSGQSVRTAGASIDVLKKDDLFAGLGIVQAVAYLESSKQLYETELLAGSLGEKDPGPGVDEQTGTASSRLYELRPDGTRFKAEDFSKNEIADISAYKASDDKEYLLLASKSSGKILRWGPVTDDTKTLKEVATGLVLPVALVVDRVSGNVLVAEKDKISTITRAQIETGLRSKPAGLTKGSPNRPFGPPSALTSTGDSTELIVDDCSGDVYFSEYANGRIGVYRRATGQTEIVAQGLYGPSDMLPVYRSGISCPASFNILVVEKDIGWVSLVVPDSGEIYGWFEVPSAFDVAFLPADNPFFPGDAGVLLGEFQNQNATLLFVYLPEDYLPYPDNSLYATECPGTIFLGDPDIESVVRILLGLNAQDPITCQAAEQLGLVISEHGTIENLDGLQYFPYLQELYFWDNYIYDIEPLAGLSLLDTVDLSDNIVFDLAPLAELYYLRQLDLSNNFIFDVTPLADLWNLDYLNLNDNLIDDVEWLTYNFGLNSGDTVDLRNNLLDLDDCRDLQQLAIQGATVHSDVDCSQLSQWADLQVLMETDPTNASFGQPLTYYSYLVNYGPATATSVLYYQYLPPETIFESFTNDANGECFLFEDTLLICVFPSIPSGYYATLQVTTTAYPFGSDPLFSVGWISAEEYDADITDNVVSLDTPVGQ